MSQAWTRAQQRHYRALVAALRAAADFGDENRRDVIERVCGRGKRSTTEIDRPQMARLIDEMRRLCRAHGVDMGRAMARPHWTQEQYVAHLEQELGWQGQPERLAGFIRRITRGWKDAALGLTRAEKSALIVALRAELRSQRDGTARRERPQPPHHTPVPRFVPGAPLRHYPVPRRDT